MVCVEKTKRQVVQEEALDIGDLYQAEGDSRYKSTPKAPEAEFPLVFSHSSLPLVPNRRAKKTVEWDELGELKYLTVVHGQSLKRLREKLDHLEIREVNPVGRLEALAGDAGRMTQLLLAHWSPSPVIVTCMASPPPRPAAASSPGPSESSHANSELQVQWGSQEVSMGGRDHSHSPIIQATAGTQCTGHHHLLSPWSHHH